jgi:hypothetical protein
MQTRFTLLDLRAYYVTRHKAQYGDLPRMHAQRGHPPGPCTTAARRRSEKAWIERDIPKLGTKTKKPTRTDWLSC